MAAAFHRGRCGGAADRRGRVGAFHPLVTGIAMAAHGVVFSATLAYVRYAKIPGACGCVLSSAEQRVTWRDLARAIVVGPIDRVVRTGARPAP
jgi:hypothetical protein